MIDVVNPYLLMNLETTNGEVETILKKLDSTKATGVDGIPTRILKICAKELAKPLKMLFNLSIQQGYMPWLWKRANITPVQKDGEKELVSKNIQFHCFLSRLNALRGLSTLPYSTVLCPISLSQWQHGFIKSCTTQLAPTYHQWAKAWMKAAILMLFSWIS